MKTKLHKFVIHMSKYGIYVMIALQSFTMAFASNSNAQRKMLDEIMIDLEITNRSIELIDLFKQIEMSTDFYFAYSKKELKNRQVSLSRSDYRMDELLKSVSVQAEVSFKRVNEQIGVAIRKSSDNLPRLVDEVIVQASIRGQVTDENGEPLPGATVVEKGGSNGTVTDIDGNYQISVESGATLVVSFVGYETKEIPVGATTTINVSLEIDVSSLEEVVVIGYGTQNKEEITSAVASVEAEDFVKGNTRDVAQLIQGKVAGLSVVNPSGDPTVGTSIRLRGNTTLVGADASPLVIIDGIPGALNTVAPEDIQSIDVLKDGSAAAIYGVRGNNGVILITTKKGGKKVKGVEYSSNVSIQEITRQAELLSASDLRGLIASGERNASDDLGASTNWLDEITRVPVSQIHNITFRGGNDQTNYVANANFRGLEGIMLKSDNKTYTVRAEINHKMFDNKVQVNGGVLNWYNKITTTADGGGFNGDTYQQTLRYNPTAPVYNEDGSYYQNVGNFNYSNPVAMLKEADGRNLAQNTRLYGSVSVFPIEGLQLKVLGSVNNYNQDRGYYETKQHISNVRDGRNGYASVGGTESVERLLDFTINYDLELGQSDVSALVGYSYQDIRRSEHWTQNWDFPSDNFAFHRIQLGRALQEGLANIYSEQWKSNLIGYFARLNYSYQNKYLLMLSVRHEGASQLWGTDKPFGTFPAGSVGWRVSEEAFMSGVSFIDNLKVRFGYGVTGSRPSNLTLGVPILSYQGQFYYDGKWVQTLGPSQNPNPNLKWEEKHESNFGLDFTVWDKRISGTVDYYQRRTKDLLYDYPVPVPPNLVGSIRTNAATIDNSGLEVTLNFNLVRTEDFEWNSTVLFSANKNELVSLGSGDYQTEGDSVLWNLGGLGEPLLNYSTHILEEGEQVGNFYGLKVVDITDDGNWVYETRDGETATAADGFTKGAEDYQVLGNGLPSFYAGWNHQFVYKKFDLSITMRGAFDYQILNATRVFYENPTVTQYNMLKSSQDLIFGKAKLNEDQEFNSYYIEDGDYWKIDNITLGYTFPDLKGIKNLRVYVSTLNTFIFTGYSGIDPEVGQLGLNPGIDNRFKYPSTRTYTLGLNLSF